MSVFFRPSCKVQQRNSEGCDISQMLQETISAENGNITSEIVSACKVVSNLRAEAGNYPTSTATLHALFRYLTCLDYLIDKCNITTLKKQLVWSSAYSLKQNSKVESLKFEKLCVLFNLGINECMLALTSTVDGSRLAEGYQDAKKHFEKASTYFEQAGNVLLPVQIQTLTLDIWSQTLQVYSKIMLGNAQQAALFYAECIQRERRPAMLARLAGGAKQIYQIAYELSVQVLRANSPSDSPIIQELGQPSKVLGCYFSFKEASYKAEEYSIEGNYGYEISWFELALQRIEVTRTELSLMVKDTANPRNFHDRMRQILDDGERVARSGLETAIERNMTMFDPRADLSKYEGRPYEMVKVLSFSGIIELMPDSCKVPDSQLKALEHIPTVGPSNGNRNSNNSGDNHMDEDRGG